MSRILILRTSSIGDIVMASAMVDPLRKAYPKAHIAWMCEPAYADMIRCHPEINAVHIWPKGKWKALLKAGRYIQWANEAIRFSLALRRERFDLVLDAQGLLRSRILARLTAAPFRIGLSSKEPGKGLMHRIVPWNREDPRICSEYGELINSLNLPAPDILKPALALCPEDTQTCDRLLTETLGDSPFAVFCPFTTRPQKHWVEDRWPQLANAIYEKWRLPAVLLGGPADAARGNEMASRCQYPFFDFSGRLSLTESAAVVRRAHLLIGVDTGLTHMGLAFDRSTVALFGSTRPYLISSNRRLQVLHEPMACSPCRRRPTCDGAFLCMVAIDVDRVMRAARSVLEEGGG